LARPSWIASFPTEDQLSDFQFGQAYTNWLTLIKTVSDSIVEQGWCAHHKCIALDRGFMEWEQAWCSHDPMLRSGFMLKPFILDVTNSAYEKQLERCKPNQALQWGCGEPHDYVCSGSQAADTSKVPSYLHVKSILLKVQSYLVMGVIAIPKCCMLQCPSIGSLGK